jgi:hypothetical protein
MRWQGAGRGRQPRRPQYLLGLQARRLRRVCPDGEDANRDEGCAQQDCLPCRIVNDVLVMMIAMHCHLTSPSAPAPWVWGPMYTTLVLGFGSTVGQIKSGTAVLWRKRHKGAGGRQLKPPLPAFQQVPFIRQSPRTARVPEPPGAPLLFLSRSRLFDGNAVAFCLTDGIMVANLTGVRGRGMKANIKKTAAASSFLFSLPKVWREYTASGSKLGKPK